MARMNTCPLCGYKFDIEGMLCHSTCPLSAGCHIVCCPNCGYQMPDQERMPLASGLKNLWERYQQSRARSGPDPDMPCAVCDLRPGQRAEITEFSPQMAAAWPA